MAQNFIVRIRGQVNDVVRQRIFERAPGLPIVERAEQFDAAGSGFFRVVVSGADSPEEASAQVQQALGDLEGYELGPVEPQVFAQTHGRSDEIYRRAIEHFVVEAMLGAAGEQERIHRNLHGEEELVKILTVDLKGSYPDTELRIAAKRRGSDEAVIGGILIWKNADFVKAAESFAGLRLWIGEILEGERGA